MTLLDDAVAAVARVRALDRVAGPVSDAVARITHRPAVATVLAGTWLGHPLHPVLTDLPIGCWTSAVTLDLVAPKSGRRAAQFLIGAGVVSAVPTAMTGLTDWADTAGDTQRIGAVHAVLNLTATACFALSWRARRRGHHFRGVVLSGLGGTIATGGAALGGHLVYRTGTGVDVNAFDAGPSDWTPASTPLRPLADGTGVIEAGARKMLASPRDGGTWHGIGARCSHRGGPLEEGRIAGGCVTCPWHQSQFRLDDGTIVRGPATAPQPRYDVEDRDGTLAVRAAGSVA
jgi:nitrite reductase/ring-hydroxylating ferredoxin subunit/uncharacterized membrane protein